jgi:putative addiction module killer protein
MDQRPQRSCRPRSRTGEGDRLAHGNPGRHRVLTGGIRELKVNFGPGYRIYYTERGGVSIILLAGGDKSSQAKDIRTAIALARNL